MATLFIYAAGDAISGWHSDDIVMKGSRSYFFMLLHTDMFSLLYTMMHITPLAEIRMSEHDWSCRISSRR